MALLVGRDFVEQFLPAAVITPANTIAMSYRPIPADCDFGGLTGDAQGLQHALVRVGHRPGKALFLPVLLQLLNALEWACADDVKRDPTVVVRANLVLQAPQLGATGGSIGGMKVEEHGLALGGEA